MLSRPGIKLQPWYRNLFKYHIYSHGQATALCGKRVHMQMVPANLPEPDLVKICKVCRRLNGKA